MIIYKDNYPIDHLISSVNSLVFPVNNGKSIAILNHADSSAIPTTIPITIDPDTRISSIAYSPTNDCIWTATNNTINAIDMKSHSLAYQYNYNSNYTAITAITASNNGTHLIFTGSELSMGSRQVELLGWDTRHLSTPLYTLKDSVNDDITKLKVHNDGWLYCASMDGLVSAFDCALLGDENNAVQMVYNATSSIMDFQVLSNDYVFAITHDNQFYCWTHSDGLPMYSSNLSLDFQVDSLVNLLDTGNTLDGGAAVDIFACMYSGESCRLSFQMLPSNHQGNVMVNGRYSGHVDEVRKCVAVGDYLYSVGDDGYLCRFSGGCGVGDSSYGGVTSTTVEMQVDKKSRSKKPFKPY